MESVRLQESKLTGFSATSFAVRICLLTTVTFLTKKKKKQARKDLKTNEELKTIVLNFFKELRKNFRKWKFENWLFD